MSVTCGRSVVFSGYMYFLRVSTTNETDRHEITEILLKVALSTKNTIPPTPLWKPRRTFKIKILIPFHKTMVIYEFIQPSIKKIMAMSLYFMNSQSYLYTWGLVRPSITLANPNRFPTVAQRCTAVCIHWLNIEALSTILGHVKMVTMVNIFVQ